MPNNPPNEILRAASVVRPSQNDGQHISFLWTPQQKLIDLIYRPGEGLRFATKIGRQGIQIREEVEGLKPLSWIEPFARKGSIRLPSEAAQYKDLDQIAAAAREFIHRYFECDPEFESVAVMYALHTWVAERFSAVPYLRFVGISGSGKTRASETIGALCYRAMVLAGAATPASMFRMIEDIGGTLLIDEADFKFSQVGSDIAKILNCGYQRGTPVVRMEPNSQNHYEPRMYEAFGPKIINGRERFRDDATESRCLPHTPRPLERIDVPRQLPPEFEAEALQIRNMLLRWRFDNLDSFEVREVRLEGVRPRTNQILMPLLLIAERLEDQRYAADVRAYAKAIDAQSLEERKSTVESWLIDAYVRWDRNTPTCKDLMQKVLSTATAYDSNLERWLTPKSVSRIVTTLGFKTKHAKRGSEVSIDSARLKSLCTRYGIVTGSSPESSRKGDGSDETVTVPAEIVTRSTYTT